MNNPLTTLLFLAVLVASSVTHVRSDASDHRYKDGDPVPLYANKVGPFHNPSETYRYFDLPFCVPDHLREKKEALGEVLNGDRLVSAPYKLNFRDEKTSAVVCKKTLTKEEVAQFRSAIEKDYYFQMYYDDLPIWGFIGKVDKQGKTDPSEYKYFLYKHIQLDVLYNKDRVIEVSVRMDPQSLLDLTEDKEVETEFLYTVKWKETDTSFEKRMEKYSLSSSLPHHLEIHWFSIINSCVTVLLLTGFLATILMRVLKNDFVKYAQDEEAADDQEETGWKYIHGDVFRYPKYKSFFAAALGSGTQLFTLTVFIFILALVGVFYPYNRGALFTALVVIYALTSGIAGYTATSFYCQLEGKNWVRNLLLTGCLFCGPLFLTFCFLNTVAIVYSATAALPFGTIVVILLIWTLVTSPLLVLGGIAGKNSKAEFQAPCRTTKYPREIPQLPWYRSTLPQMAMAAGNSQVVSYAFRVFGLNSVLMVTGLFYVVDRLGFLSMLIACTTTMHDLICLASCKPLSSLDTWPAYAMASFSCLGQWVSVPRCSLFATYTSRLSVSRVGLFSLSVSVNSIRETSMILFKVRLETVFGIRS
ncbi:hypothetical protein GH714_041993 [Hevea brasiliensis]|uniref:Transmembrane 9 superfamily member n=1 Tax=Hevea brasiliensis TaxID=3981 RepID=A0A6A6MRX5_HEVBR|nr:hypothetical protein GH714_041993 [Hevea brasiliensis]